MAKPTLLQALFNRPSQSYSIPPPPPSHDYHSLKAHMLRAVSDDDTPGLPLGTSLMHGIIVPTSNPEMAVDDSDSDNDVFYTPVSSPRVSVNCEELSLESSHGTDNHHSDAPDVIPSPQSISSRASSSSPSLISTSSTLAYSNSGCSPFSWSTYSESSSRPTTPADTDSDQSPYSGRVSPSTTRRRRIRSSSRTQVTPKLMEDWAKDVRWLVPLQETHKRASKRSPRSNTRRSNPEPATTTESSMPANPPRRRSSTISSRAKPDHTRNKERMSALLEEDEDDDALTPHSHLGHSTAAHTPSSVRTRTISAPHSVPPRPPPSARSGASRISTTSTSSFITASSRTVHLPVPLPVSDGGTPTGYTSLVLPRAAPLAHKRGSIFSNHGTVDMTLSGLAQTTMSTISLMKDGGAVTLARTHRFSSISAGLITFSGKSASSKLTPTPKHLLLSLPSPLSFTSHTPPPSKVQSGQVLVQVWAVGLDSLDDTIVQEKAARHDGYGFIPGRSFVGRAIECGYEVNSISKSDWVMGLLDVRKCGALSEFIVVDKRRLTRSPLPSPTLTLEQLALLPLCGIPAHRAIRTCAFLQRGARALVLQAHDSAGALAVQELAALGVHVTAQIPPDIGGDQKSVDGLELEERVRRWGAQDVISEYPVAAVNMLHESEFDLVVDTVGGRRIWDACRRVLHSTGQFTTLVGDSGQAVPSMNALFKSNMRSLRRAFIKKDRKALGYAWVSPVADVDGEGEDIRDSLIAVAKVASNGFLTPWIGPRGRIPFERATMAFGGGHEGALGTGQTAVVRIVD